MSAVVEKPVFTEEENRAFINYLGKVRENNFFFPTEETMRAVHKAVSFWALELIVVRRTPQGLEILLKVYEDGAEAFLGMWHTPGGYNKWMEEDLQATVSRIAKREIGLDAEYVSALPFPYKWKGQEHPYGHPLSLLVKVGLRGEVQETDTLKFFPLSDLPPELIPVQRDFILKNIRS